MTRWFLIWGIAAIWLSLLPCAWSEKSADSGTGAGSEKSADSGTGAGSEKSADSGTGAGSEKSADSGTGARSEKSDNWAEIRALFETTCHLDPEEAYFYTQSPYRFTPEYFRMISSSRPGGAFKGKNKEAEKVYVHFTPNSIWGIQMQSGQFQVWSACGALWGWC